MPIAGWTTSTGLPQLLQNWRWLASVFLNMPSLSAPFTTRTLAAGQSAAAWIGAPSQPRHELQWQYAWTLGSPDTSSSTAPQKQEPLRVLIGASSGPGRLSCRRRGGCQRQAPSAASPSAGRRSRPPEAVLWHRRRTYSFGRRDWVAGAGVPETSAPASRGSGTMKKR